MEDESVYVRCACLSVHRYIGVRCMGSCGVHVYVCMMYVRVTPWVTCVRACMGVRAWMVCVRMTLGHTSRVRQ